MAFVHPHTIENGQGEVLTFEGIREDADGEYMAVSNRVRPGAGPPMHVHFQQDESLTVVSGRMGYQILGEEPRFLEPGESIVFVRNQAHRFWAEGDEDLLCEGWVRPPHNIEYFLTEVFRSTRERGGRPDDFDAAFLMHRYRTEFDMLEIPGFVKAVVFPALRTIGALTGKFKRFDDAPPPV